MRSWRERIATPSGYASHNPHPAVPWASHRHDLVLDINRVLHPVPAMGGTLEDEPFEEPTEEEIDGWLPSMMEDEAST